MKGSVEEIRSARIARFAEILAGEMKPSSGEEAEATIQALCCILASSFAASRQIPKSSIQRLTNDIYDGLFDWDQEWKARQ